MNWAVSFPLVVVALAVSPRDVFMQHWAQSIEAVMSRLKVGRCLAKLMTRTAPSEPSP
jgi:hypothetical protein